MTYECWLNIVIRFTQGEYVMIPTWDANDDVEASLLLAPPPLAFTGDGNKWWMEVTADCPAPSAAATAAAFLGEPPFCDSVDGVGLSVTECAWR